MKHLLIALLSTLAFCQTVEHDQHSFSLFVPDSWTVRHQESPENKKFSVPIYACSANRFYYNLASMHREFVYVGVKVHTKPFDGINSAADREAHLQKLHTEQRKSKNSAIVKVKKLASYEKDGLHILDFESQMPAYNHSIYNIIRHVITRDKTYVLFGMTLVDDNLDINKRIIYKIQNSFEVE